MALRTPPSGGVSIGPFRATPLSRIDEIAEAGIASPRSSHARSPMSWTSQRTSTPVASTTRRPASVTSGPIPSPGISVMRWTTGSLPRASSGQGNGVRLSWQLASDPAGAHRSTGGEREERGRQGAPRGHRGGHPPVRHRRREGHPFVRGVRDRGSRRPLLVRGGRVPAPPPGAPHGPAARRALRVPRGGTGPPPLPGAADGDPGRADLADVDAADIRLRRFGVRPRRVGRVRGGAGPEGPAADRQDGIAPDDLSPAAHRDGRSCHRTPPSDTRPTSSGCCTARSPTRRTYVCSTRPSCSTPTTR